MDAHCFIDGGHLRAISRESGKPLVDPRRLANRIAYSLLVQNWRTANFHARKGLLSNPNPADVRVGLTRVIYYDARPDGSGSASSGNAIESYWETIEHLLDTEIGWGVLRGRPRRQKRVDSLIAVDMLTGAFESLFRVAILVAADADFVPVVDEVRRRGAMVVVAAKGNSLSDELRKAADRVWLINPADDSEFPPLQDDNRNVWTESASGGVQLQKA